MSLALLVLISSWLISNYYERSFLTTGPNGPETPGTIGIPYERVSIPSNGRKLDSYLVAAPERCESPAALLIFHGVQETISEWVKTQGFLYDHCVSSLVFDYSGHGSSSRPGNIKNLNDDAIAAYKYFTFRFGRSGRLCVLGHSMGNAPMLEALPSFQPPPSCVVVGNAFSSLRDEIAHSAAMRGPLRLLQYAMPDKWNNVKNVSRNHVPLLLIHSDSDTVNPIEMGMRIFQAAPQPKQIVVLHGFKHNALYRDPRLEWWASVLDFLKGVRTKT